MELKIGSSAGPDGIQILTLTGKVNAVTVTELKTLLKKNIEEDTIRIILDLEGVDFIDSSGLSSLISALKGCREKGGYLRLVHIQKQVKHVFELTMLDRVFEMYPSVEAALAT